MEISVAGGMSTASLPCINYILLTLFGGTRGGESSVFWMKAWPTAPPPRTSLIYSFVFNEVSDDLKHQLHIFIST